MFLCMSAIAGIGFLIKYTLINGQERWMVYNDHVELYFWGMDRHEWGSVHLIIAYVLLGLLVLHIILHWKIVVCVYDKMVQRKLARKLISVVFIAIALLFNVVPFFVKPTVCKIEQGAGKHTTNYHSNDYPVYKKKGKNQFVHRVLEENKVYKLGESANN